MATHPTRPTSSPSPPPARPPSPWSAYARPHGFWATARAARQAATERRTIAARTRALADADHTARLAADQARELTAAAERARTYATQTAQQATHESARQATTPTAPARRTPPPARVVTPATRPQKTATTTSRSAGTVGRWWTRWTRTPTPATPQAAPTPPTSPAASPAESGTPAGSPTRPGTPPTQTPAPSPEATSESAEQAVTRAQPAAAQPAAAQQESTSNPDLARATADLARATAELARAAGAPGSPQDRLIAYRDAAQTSQDATATWLDAVRDGAPTANISTARRAHLTAYAHLTARAEVDLAKGPGIAQAITGRIHRADAYGIRTLITALSPTEQAAVGNLAHHMALSAPTSPSASSARAFAAAAVVLHTAPDAHNVCVAAAWDTWQREQHARLAADPEFAAQIAALDAARAQNTPPAARINTPHHDRQAASPATGEQAKTTTAAPNPTQADTQGDAAGFYRDMARVRPRALALTDPVTAPLPTGPRARTTPARVRPAICTTRALAPATTEDDDAAGA